MEGERGYVKRGEGVWTAYNPYMHKKDQVNIVEGRKK